MATVIRPSSREASRRCKFSSASGTPKLGRRLRWSWAWPTGAKSTSTTLPWDCCRASAVLTAAVVAPAPPLALRKVKTRALPAPPRVRVRLELKRVRASSRASELALSSRYSPAPARMLATMVAGCCMLPLAKMASCKVLAWMSSMALMAG